MVDAVQTSVSEQEWQARVHLAALYRLVALRGWDDLIFTHISIRVPGPEHHFLINPYGMLFEEITASCLVKIDEQGQKISQSPYEVNPAGFVIHSAIHMAREDAHCVIHLHTPHGQAVSAQRSGLRPLTQTAMIVIDELAYHDYEGIATREDERERLAADLGDKHLLLLRNHGTLAVGPTAADAWSRIYFLERACEAQIMALSAGPDGLNPAPAGSPERTAAEAKYSSEQGIPALTFSALLRMLDRKDPSYRQ